MSKSRKRNPLTPAQKEAARERQKRFKARHPNLKRVLTPVQREAAREASRRFRKRHPDCGKQYYAATKERQKEKRGEKREWYLQYMRDYHKRPEVIARRPTWSNNQDPIKRRQSAMKRLAQMKTTSVGKVSYNKALEESMGLCGICNRPLSDLPFHFDHIIPLSRGGEHVQDNIQVTHATCNLKKNKRLPEEYSPEPLPLEDGSWRQPDFQPTSVSIH